MLFLNDQKISAKELCEKYGVNYNKVSKAPIFKAGKSSLFLDKSTGKMKPNQGTSVRTRFTVRQPDGTVDIIQYAQTASPQIKNGATITEYNPRYVRFQGTTVNMKDDIDKAVFFAINPNINSSSPLRDSRVHKYDYLRTFDPKAEAIAEMKDLDNLEKALVHSSTVSIENARLLLKAVRKKGNIDSMSDEEVRVDIRKIAKSNPDTYISHVNNQAMLFEGKIRDLIDKKVFILKTSSGIRQWLWGSGDKEGSFIGQAIQNPRDDEREYLVRHILNNPELYADDIMKEHQSNHSQGYAKVNEYFDNLKVKSEQSAFVGENIIVDKDLLNPDAPKIPDHEDNEEVKSWLKSHGYKLVPTQVKIFREALSTGNLTAANIHEFASQNIDKASGAE